MLPLCISKTPAFIHISSEDSSDHYIFVKISEIMQNIMKGFHAADMSANYGTVVNVFRGVSSSPSIDFSVVSS